MIKGDTRFRVWNYAKYDIGVKLMTGFEYNIKPGAFIMMTADDILYIESSYPNAAYFSKRLLVPTDESGNSIDIIELGMPQRETDVHQSDDEIIAILKGSAKKMEAWVAEIKDPSELHNIYEVAKDIDLPISKTKILKKYMPDKDWLDELGS